MGRYRNDMDDRDYYPREERLRRDTLGSYEEPYNRRPQFDTERRWDSEGRSDYGRGRFGERANYENNEPRYSNARERWDENRFRDQRRRSTLEEIRGDLGTGRDRERYNPERSRLRCRDVMTTDLAVATRDTRLTQIALMMKQEDTGVIPVVEYDAMSGNGRTDTDRGDLEGRDDRQYDTRTYSRGKLVGLITDRDLVIRAVAEGKDCNNTRAEDIMSVDIHTTRPNDRVVDVIRMMANKQVRRIPVVNDNRYLVGMISMADVAQEVDDDRELGEALEEISKTTSFWNRVFG
jgi:CBS domain-containing protein